MTSFLEEATDNTLIEEDNNPGDEPLNLKLTQLLDVQVGSKQNTWKNDLFKLLKSRINEEKLENIDEYPPKHTFIVEKNKVDSNGLNFLDFHKGCKSLVGTSKIPLCDFDTNVGDSDPKKIFPRSCREILEKGNNKSGVYDIQPKTNDKPFSVLCDMETKGGGWTHIQKRFDGSEDFYRNWRDYKFGFGKLNGEFWMGLETIYDITAFEISELLIELTDRDINNGYAHYATFAIGAEKDGYPLSVLKEFTGDAGDALTGHAGAKFTTKDVDQDSNPTNCAVTYEGAWWYKSCHSSNLNGKFMNIALSDIYKYHGLNWSGFRGQEYNLAGSRMMVRPRQS